VYSERWHHFEGVDVLLPSVLVVFSALTLLVGRQQGHPARKKCGGMVEVGTG